MWGFTQGTCIKIKTNFQSENETVPLSTYCVFILERKPLTIPIPMIFQITRTKNYTRCWCRETENTNRIYLCKYWTEQSKQYSFDILYKDNMYKSVQI